MPTFPTFENAPRKRGHDLAVGDIIRVLGGDHMITVLEPYPNPHLFDFMDDRWQIARSGAFGMTIEPDHTWLQLPDGAWVGSHLYERELAKISKVASA